MGPRGAETSPAERILVPARPSADLEPLLEALSRRFALVRWSPPAVPPSGALPHLVDARSEEALAALERSDDVAQVLLVVAEEESIDRVAAGNANVLQVISPRWPASFAVRCIEIALRSWGRLRRAYEEDENIIEIQQEVVKSLGDIVKLKQKLATRTEALEERNIELTVKNNELGRLNEFKAGVLGRLGDPDAGYIGDILRHTREVNEEAGASAKVQAAAQALHETALKIKHIFRPYDFYAKAELALHGKSILVAVSKRKARKLLVRALLGTGAAVETIATTEAEAEGPRPPAVDDARLAEISERLRSGSAHVLFLDWENAALIPTAVEIAPDIHVVLITSRETFENNIQAMKELPVSNLLITDEMSLSEAPDPILVQQIVVTAGKLLSGDIFGLEKYLAWGTLIREEIITSTEQKDAVAATIHKYAAQCGLRDRACRGLETLTDELLMNALWDAPTDAKGEPKYAERNRRNVLDLLPHEAALLRYGSDGNLLGISVSDPFGALDRGQAFHYLVKCFAKGDDQINYGAGGAGLGLFQAFLAVSTFVINVRPGEKTEVVGLLNMNLSRKELAQQRSYQYFRTPAKRPSPGH